MPCDGTEPPQIRPCWVSLKKTFPYMLTLNIDISTSQMTQHGTDTRIGKTALVLFLESSGPGCSKAG